MVVRFEPMPTISLTLGGPFTKPTTALRTPPPAHSPSCLSALLSPNLQYAEQGRAWPMPRTDAGRPNPYGQQQHRPGTRTGTRTRPRRPSDPTPTHATTAQVDCFPLPL